MLTTSRNRNIWTKRAIFKWLTRVVTSLLCFVFFFCRANDWFKKLVEHAVHVSQSERKCCLLRANQRLSNQSRVAAFPALTTGDTWLRVLIVLFAPSWLDMSFRYFKVSIVIGKPLCLQLEVDKLAGFRSFGFFSGEGLTFICQSCRRSTYDLVSSWKISLDPASCLLCSKSLDRHTTLLKRSNATLLETTVAWRAK